MNDGQSLEDMLRLRFDPLEGKDEEVARLRNYEIRTVQDMVDFTVRLLEIYDVAKERISYDYDTKIRAADDYIEQIKNPSYELTLGGANWRKYPHSVSDVIYRKKTLLSDASLKKGQVIKRLGEELNSENVDIRTEDKSIHFHLEDRHYKFGFDSPEKGIATLVRIGILFIKQYREDKNATPIYIPHT